MDAASVHPVETPVESRSAGEQIDARIREYCSFASVEALPQPADQAELDWRHKGLRWKRRRIMLAMIRTRRPPPRVARYRECGANAWVEQSPSTGRYRVVSNCCRDRWCQPCQQERSWRLRLRVEQAARRKADLRLLTLTLKHRPAALAGEVDRLLASFRKLRESQLWKTAVTGGIGVIEVKPGTGGLWHVHLHAVIEGRFIDQTKLSAQWRKCTGDSHIVDIRAVRDPASAASYVSKYVTKPFDKSLLASDDHLDEAILGLAGRQLYLILGSWRALNPDELIPADPGDWRRVVSVRDLMRDAGAGQPYALGLVHALTHSRDPPDAARPGTGAQPLNPPCRSADAVPMGEPSLTVDAGRPSARNLARSTSHPLKLARYGQV